MTVVSRPSLRHHGEPVSVTVAICPKCQRTLAIIEVIERFCERCGEVAPCEVVR